MLLGTTDELEVEVETYGVASVSGILTLEVVEISSS